MRPRTASFWLFCFRVFCRPISLSLHTGFCRPISLSLNTGSFRAYFAIAQYGLLSRLFRYRSIRALFAPISLSLHTALWLRLCARAGALRAYAYAVALLPAAIRATFGCSLDDMPFGNNSARFLEYRCKRNERRLDRFGFENTRVHKKLSFFFVAVSRSFMRQSPSSENSKMMQIVIWA